MEVRLLQVSIDSHHTLLLVIAVVVNKIIEGLSKGDTYFAEGCVMLILQPVEIEGQNISETFNEWKPEIEGYADISLLVHTLYISSYAF